MFWYRYRFAHWKSSQERHLQFEDGYATALDIKARVMLSWGMSPLECSVAVFSAEDLAMSEPIPNDSFVKPNSSLVLVRLPNSGVEAREAKLQEGRVQNMRKAARVSVVHEETRLDAMKASLREQAGGRR
jgi:hypothetical protein